MIFFEIPAIAIVIALILGVGVLDGIKPGDIFNFAGWFLLIVGTIFALVGLCSETKNAEGKLYGGIFTAVIGIIAFLIGGWFGEHTLFEFLFGTGWF